MLEWRLQVNRKNATEIKCWDNVSVQTKMDGKFHARPRREGPINCFRVNHYITLKVSLYDNRKPKLTMLTKIKRLFNVCMLSGKSLACQPCTYIIIFINI